MPVRGGPTTMLSPCSEESAPCVSPWRLGPAAIDSIPWIDGPASAPNASRNMPASIIQGRLATA